MGTGQEKVRDNHKHKVSHEQKQSKRRKEFEKLKRQVKGKQAMQISIEYLNSMPVIMKVALMHTVKFDKLWNDNRKR